MHSLHKLCTRSSISGRRNFEFPAFSTQRTAGPICRLFVQCAEVLVCQASKLRGQIICNQKKKTNRSVIKWKSSSNHNFDLMECFNLTIFFHIRPQLSRAQAGPVCTLFALCAEVPVRRSAQTERANYLQSKQTDKSIDYRINFVKTRWRLTCY